MGFCPPVQGVIITRFHGQTPGVVCVWRAFHTLQITQIHTATRPVQDNAPRFFRNAVR